jgi:6-phosphogluconolactonase (cycloisomerase 2 family)
VSTSGKFLFAVGSRSSRIVDFALNRQSGSTLRNVAFSTAVTGSDPVALAVGTGGRHAYVANFRSGTVSQFSVGPLGRIRLRHTVAAGFGPTDIILSPNDEFAYVTDEMTGTITTFKVHRSGRLARMTPTVSTGPSPLALTAAGRYVYAVNYLGASVSEYLVQADGVLRPASSSLLPTLMAPSALVPYRGLLYVASSLDNSIVAYRIGGTGLLGPTNLRAKLAAFGPSSLVIDPDPPN